jgi:spore coat protein CotF
MEEKYMVNDILESSKTQINSYTHAIISSENMELRQTLQTIRNNNESFQYELFKLASSKGYYNPTEQAKPENINQIKSTLTML